MEILSDAKKWLENIDGKEFANYLDVYKLKSQEDWDNYASFNLVFEEVVILKKRRHAFRVSITASKNKPAIYRPAFALEYDEIRRAKKAKKVTNE